MAWRTRSLFRPLCTGLVVPKLLVPKEARRMRASPRANGELRDLLMSDFRAFVVKVRAPGAVEAEDTRVLGRLLRDVIRVNQARRTFRSVGTSRSSGKTHVETRGWS